MFSERIPRNILSNRLEGIFLTIGVLTLILSILYASPVLALIGLSFTFWGVLFFFLSPVQRVDGGLLGGIATAEYATIDRIIGDFKVKGQYYYIPPYPKDVYLPEYLKGLKDSVVFVSAKDGVTLPPIEHLAQGKFMLDDTGVLVAPPGLGLLNTFEKNLNMDLAKVSLDDLCEIVPRVVSEQLVLAKSVEMNAVENQVHLKIFDSVYKSLYNRENNLMSIEFLGCPVVSAVACAIAKSSGKTITIQKLAASSDGLTLNVWYAFVQS